MKNNKEYLMKFGILVFILNLVTWFFFAYKINFNGSIDSTFIGYIQFFIGVMISVLLGCLTKNSPLQNFLKNIFTIILYVLFFILLFLTFFKINIFYGYMNYFISIFLIIIFLLSYTLSSVEEQWDKNFFKVWSIVGLFMFVILWIMISLILI